MMPGLTLHQAVLGVLHPCLEQCAVQAAQADGLAAHPVQGGHQVFVHLAAQHVLHHVHGLLVGVTQAVYELGFLADLLQHGGNFRAAAVDDHHVDAHQGEQNDVAHHRFAQLFGDHGVAAVLDDDDLAVVFLDIGKRLNECLGAGEVIIGQSGSHSLSGKDFLGYQVR